MVRPKIIRGKQLYRILVVGVISAVILIAVLALLGVREVRRDAASVAVESSAKGLAGAVTVLVNAVTSSNDEIGMRQIQSLEPAALRESFRDMMQKHENVGAVLVSDGHGLLYSLAKRDDGLVEMVSAKDGESSRLSLLSPDGSLDKTQHKFSFNRAAIDKGLVGEFFSLEPGVVSWWSIYAIYKSGETLLAASSLAEVQGKRVMISYVFPISAVVSQLGGAEKGSAERIFLYWASGKVLPVHGVNAGGQSSSSLEALAINEVSDPVIARATDILGTVPGAADGPFHYTVGGEVWWSYVFPLSVFGDTMSLGVAVPLKNVSSTLTSDKFLLWFSGALALLASLILFILHRNRGRIEAIGLRQNAPQTAEEVLRLIEDGESRILEFKQTLRFNLNAGKNGKEIEHACMKSIAGFLNSDGGTLLVGVADNGEITGFEEDKLGSDDKALLHFNNLLNQQVGTEFARYLDTSIIEVQGKRVLRAYCIPSATPAILKNGQCEEFYVRSGPASRQLTFSQFYEWLKEH